MDQMKYYYLEAPQKIKTVEGSIPSPGPEEVLIQVTNLGLCGSDLHLFNGTYSGPVAYPILFGHEWSGVVVAVGAPVTRFQKGDRVTGDCSRYCGGCPNCAVDKNLCQTIEKFGITIDGASAQYIVRKQQYLYQAPPKMPLDLICLAEPIAVAAHLIRKVAAVGGDLKQKRILIYGAGPIGLAALMLLKKAFACETVDLFDVIPERTALAQKLGATIPTAASLQIQVDPNNYGQLYTRPVYDLVLETTGNSGVFQNTLNITKPDGVIGCVGMIAKTEIAQKNIVVKGLTVVGSIGGTGEFDFVLDFVNQNQAYVRNLISHRFPIAELEKAFAVSRNQTEVMKVQLIF
jgi:L-iditol 2-dehydrogenase